jgi:transposase
MPIMETMERSKRRDRRSYSPEFKSEIVDRCRAGDRSIGEVARDFDLTESAVRRWVAQAEIDAGERPGLSTEEREELSRLRRENKRLQADVDLLKRATAFFAKETR